MSRVLPSAGELLQRVLPPGSLALKRPPVLADVTSPVLKMELQTKVPTGGPVVLQNPGSGFAAVVNVAPLTSWTLQDRPAPGRHVDTWA
jgi:hypothetical protein